MSHIEKICEASKRLSDQAQQQLLDFAEYLQMKEEKNEMDYRMIEKKENRKPHPEIAGKAKILGNIIDSVSESDWNLPR